LEALRLASELLLTDTLQIMIRDILELPLVKSTDNQALRLLKKLLITSKALISSKQVVNTDPMRSKV
jgi:hypothetical protein